MKKPITVQEIAGVLDHTLLKPDATDEALLKACAVAKEYHTAAMCVRPSDLPTVCRELKGTGIHPATVIGFPHGTCTTETKVAETKDAIEKGAEECDMVMHVGKLLSGDYAYVLKDMKAVAEAAHEGGAILKVILETFYLNDDQIIRACELAKEAGCDYVKTSTGYAGGGATVHDVELMKAHADGMKVKAAGGIRSLDACLAMIAAGASRCGTSSSEAILKEAKEREAQGSLKTAKKQDLSNESNHDRNRL